MSRTTFTGWRRYLVWAPLAVAVGGTLVAAMPADAASNPAHHPAHHRPEPVRAGSGYLALGDSVPFGFRESANLPIPDYTNAANFVGYPEDIAAELSLRTTNAACPGETTSSLIDDTAPSNGCENAYRAHFPLHVAYSGSQLDFAVHYLRRNRDTRLVSLMIGANDGFLCRATTADHCVSELPSVLQTVGKNVRTILTAIRDHAGYRGQIVLVDYYSLDYSDPVQNASSQALNSTLAAAVQPFHVRIADAFGVFQRAAAQAGGKTCTAGLLTTLTTGGCGVHPSVAGQELLAGTVERVLDEK
jgi:lysophospholipase L1-like esterase